MHGWCRLQSRTNANVLRAWLGIELVGSEWVQHPGGAPLADAAYNGWLSAAAAAAVTVDVWPAPGNTEMEADAGACLPSEAYSECPVQSNTARWADGGRLLDNFLQPPARGSTLREAASVLLVTTQDPRLLQLLQERFQPGGLNELGVSESRLCNDGDMSLLLE